MFTPPDSNPIDPLAFQRLQDMLGSKANSMIPDLIEKYLVQGRRLQREMLEAIQHNDAAEVRLLAHSFKSNSAYFGADVLTALCAQLEWMAKNGNLDGAGFIVVQIGEEFGRVADHLNVILSEWGQHG